jgi:hypothetical protein
MYGLCLKNRCSGSAFHNLWEIKMKEFITSSLWPKEYWKDTFERLS